LNRHASKFNNSNNNNSNNEGKIKLLAISLGGMVAVAWAERYPQELQRMVLINTSLAPHNPFYQRLRPANYPAIIATMLTGTQRQREQLILRLTSHQSDAPQAEQLLNDWVHYAQQYRSAAATSCVNWSPRCATAPRHRHRKCRC
jgi:pimeloyl-ACP methyl ester carboxylesterase